MAKYHVNPASGEPGLCRARKSCPFGRADEHFSSKELAREAFEYSQEAFSKPLKNSAATEIALSSSLAWKGETPAWLGLRAQLQRELFGTSPEILDEIPSKIGPLLVVWEQDSVSEVDKHVELERGYECERITLNDSKGNVVGYLKMGYMDERSLNRSFGTDEWRAFAWAEDAKGEGYGFENYERNAKGKLEKVSVLRTEQSPDERVKALQRVWARTSIALNITPPNVDRSKLTWGSLINLNESMAPESQAELEAHISTLREKLSNEMSEDTQRAATPIIDYITLDDELRGEGLGHTLYTFGARVQGRAGRVLKGSGVQTPEAQKSWSLMKRAGLPVKMQEVSFGGRVPNENRLVLDFRV